MSRKALDLTYAELMRVHPFGTALYLPVPSSQFHPGTIGYFDSAGAWNPVGDMSTPSTLPSTLTSIDTSDLAQAPSQRQIWGPKLGIETRGRAVDLSAGIGAIPLLAATGGAVPFDVSACFRFQSAKDKGAILLTSGPVVHERYYHKEPFLQWMRQNARNLATAYPEVKNHGVWIVTSTWAAKDASVNCWKSPAKAVDVGFSATALEFGEVAPKGSWLHAGSAEGWVTARSDEDNQGNVVFFYGIRFTWIPIRGEKKTRKFRGHTPSGLETLVTLENASESAPGDMFEIQYEDYFEDYFERQEQELGEEDGDDDAWE
ncbi:hypothetical protein BKA56DRAFT_230390 [Ilyonectria sp. MPI-CAGE-AT-0026]|nr:hypothetical protein BKA56DRAFT_230390 [Ilyonectria sp. MPI-CAGE-AT-0026]